MSESPDLIFTDLASTNERAWAAGFFDGEGTIDVVYRSKPNRKIPPVGYVRIRVSNTELYPLNRFRCAAGRVGKIYSRDTRKNHPHYKIGYSLEITSKRDVAKAIMSLLPFLSTPKANQLLGALIEAKESRVGTRRPGVLEWPTKD